MAKLTPPSDALVLGFGVAIAAATYAYWTVIEWGRAGALTSLPAQRAGIALAATLLLTLVLHVARALDDGRSGGGDRPGDGGH